MGVRVYGSAAISFAKVLSGRLLTYITYLQPWDYAAASILGESLGYRLLTVSGEPAVEKYEAILEDEARDFLASFKQEAVSAFRVNPLKESQLSFADAIPYTPWGYYGKVSGKSPEHATGLVYSQEPAAQMVAQVAQPSPGMFCVSTKIGRAS